jgi:hypothetical protein
MLARRPETAYESNLLFALLEHYLDDQNHHRGIIGPELKTLLTDFLGKSFTYEQQELFAHNFNTVMTLGKITSQVVEVETSALKQQGFAQTPQDGIEKTHTKIADRSD